MNSNPQLNEQKGIMTSMSTPLSGTFEDAYFSGLTTLDNISDISEYTYRNEANINSGNTLMFASGKHPKKPFRILVKNTSGNDVTLSLPDYLTVWDQSKEIVLAPYCHVEVVIIPYSSMLKTTYEYYNTPAVLYIPDPDLKRALYHLINTHAIPGEITKEEAMTVMYLPPHFLYGHPVQTLEGLQHFENITDIPDAAFENCHQLAEVILPKKLQYIGSRAFRLCMSLEYITLPDSIIDIREEAFEGCHHLKELVLPNNIQHIGQRIFKDCAELENVIFSGSVMHIAEEAFENCYQLREVLIAENIYNIGPRAFKNCTSLESVRLPGIQSDLDIYEEAFKDSSIRHIDLNNAVHIGDMAFYNTQIEHIHFGRIQSIGKYAFAFNAHLSQIMINGPLQSIEEGAFKNCAMITDINIPSTVTCINKETFMGCSSLSFILLDFVSIINDSAFEGCNLNTVNLGMINHIGDKAFFRNQLLETIEFGRDCSFIGSEAFAETNITNLDFSSHTPIIVPTLASQAFARCHRLNAIQVGRSDWPVDDQLNNWTTDAFIDCDPACNMTIYYSEPASRYFEGSGGNPINIIYIQI
ncbi:MAG: leucine-rich repeat domain-containing protein [Tannerella sp.]|jgi:hypothetical protein|nr:leucine-rich repeat domain-containing protein [Tannerella sp.]